MKISIGVIGDEKVGKSSLISKLCKSQRCFKRNSRGVQIFRRESFEFIEFDKDDSTQDYKNVDRFLIVCDLSRKETFEIEQIEKFFKKIRDHNEVAEIFLVGNKIDIHEYIRRAEKLTKVSRKLYLPVFFISTIFDIGLEELLFQRPKL